MKKFLLVLLLGLLTFGVYSQDSTLLDTSKITPEQIATVIDSQIQPTLDFISEQIKELPIGGGVSLWVQWGVSFLMGLFGLLTAVWFSGNKRNLKLD